MDTTDTTEIQKPKRHKTSGYKLDYREEESEQVRQKAKAECELSDGLYELLVAYQDRFHAQGKQTWAMPFSEKEKVGELSLPLSRLYNQLWALGICIKKKGRPRREGEQQKQLKEAA